MKLGSIFMALNAQADSVPARIMLIPAGSVVRGRDGRAWNNADPAKVVRATAARGLDLAIDINHAIDLKAPKGDDAPAVGWIGATSLNEAGEIWGDVEWTDQGRALLAEKKYRYLSPVFYYDEKTMDIRAIAGAALTNRPNLDIPALNSESIQEDTSMKKLLAALGLPETATEDQALQALNAVQGSTATNAQAASVDLTAYAPRADLQLMEARALNAEGELKTLKAGDLLKRAESAVDGAIKDRKIAPASKDAYLAMCSSEDGLKNFEAVVKATPALIPEKLATPPGTPPGGEAALNAEELALAKSAGYSEAEWNKVKEAGK